MNSYGNRESIHLPIYWAVNRTIIKYFPQRSFKSLARSLRQLHVLVTSIMLKNIYFLCVKNDVT